MIDFTKDITKEELEEFLARPTINGLITAKPLEHKLLKPIIANCRQCDLMFGFVIIAEESEYDFICTKCAYEEDDNAY